MTAVALQRKNMIESQVRPSDVTDRRIIRAMQNLPRENFVPASQAAIAYGDLEVPLTSVKPGQAARSLMPARVFAKLVQLASIESSDTVLIVGSGMGYSAAVVASLAKQVTALECDATLSAHAKAACETLSLTTIDFVTGPLPGGAPKATPYDVIIVEGAIDIEPAGLLQQLAPGGRLAAISGFGPGGKATLWTRHSLGTSFVQAFDAAACALPGFARVAAFRF